MLKSDNRKCIVCGTSKFVVDYYKEVSYWEYPDRFDYFECTNCGLCFQKIKRGQDKQSKFYDNETYWSQDLENLKKSGKLEKLIRQKFGNIYDFILSKKKNGSIFDIGTGSGAFLSMFNQKEWKTYGFDVSKSAALIAKKHYGLKIKVLRNFMNYKVKEKFDFVTMLNSLEHVRYPNKYLKKAKELLKENGYLIIQVPNFASLGSLIFRTKWYPLQPGRHLYNFNPRNIRILLESIGFEVMDINHRNKSHAIYGLFQSIRFLGPKKRLYIKKRNTNKNVDSIEIKSLNNYKKKLLVYISNIFSFLIYIIGSLLKKGEYITVYAKK